MRIMMGYEFGPGLEYAVLGLEVLAEANGAVRIRTSGMRTGWRRSVQRVRSAWGEPACPFAPRGQRKNHRVPKWVKTGRPLLRNKLRSKMIRPQSYQLNLAGRSAASSSRLPVPVLVIAL